MTRNRSGCSHSGRQVLLAGLPVALLAAALALPSVAFAQRGGGDRGGGRDGGRDNSPSPRRDYSPPSRDNSAPRRDYSPPARDNSAPRRDYSPPARDYAPPRREYSPPSRDYGSPRRDSSPPVRDYSGQRTSPFTPSYRDNASPRREYDFTPRSQNNAFGRDQQPFTRQDNPTPRRDPWVRRDDTAPRRDTVQPAPTTRPQDRVIPDRSSVDSRPRDLYSFRRDQGVDRRNPTARDGQETHGIVGRTPDRQRYDARSRTESGRTFDPAPLRNTPRDLFSRTEEGRRFDNGIYLRPGGYIADRRIRHYFSNDYSYYPYYSPVFDVGLTYWSPYSFYYGVCPPYIYRRHVFYYPPPIVYIEIPLYSGDRCRGYDDELDDYYLNSGRYRNYDARDAGLDSAIDQIRDTFRTGNVDALADLTDPNVRIAVFLRGKYDYSVAPGDYLDMTRDALRTTDTITFDLYRVHRRAAGVYVVSGKHVYRDRDGERRTVYVSYVLERISGRWILTQIGTAPDRIQEP